MRLKSSGSKKLRFWPIFLKDLAQQHKASFQNMPVCYSPQYVEVSKHSDETIDFALFQRLASAAWSERWESVSFKL